MSEKKKEVKSSKRLRAGKKLEDKKPLTVSGFTFTGSSDVASPK